MINYENFGIMDNSVIDTTNTNINMTKSEQVNYTTNTTIMGSSVSGITDDNMTVIGSIPTFSNNDEYANVSTILITDTEAASQTTECSNILSTTTPNFQIQPITSVVYLIVLPDNTYLELREQNPITPREMIGLCKFINTIQLVSNAHVEVNWEKLIQDLNITRHFIPYVPNNDVGDGVFYVKLLSK
jgi:hypothetical protein